MDESRINAKKVLKKLLENSNSETFDGLYGLDEILQKYRSKGVDIKVGKEYIHARGKKHIIKQFFNELHNIGLQVFKEPYDEFEDSLVARHI